MGVMVSEVYDAFLAAGAPEDKARAAAESIPISDQLATKKRHHRTQDRHRQPESRFQDHQVYLRSCCHPLAPKDCILLLLIGLIQVLGVEETSLIDRCECRGRWGDRNVPPFSEKNPGEATRRGGLLVPPSSSTFRGRAVVGRPTARERARFFWVDSSGPGAGGGASEKTWSGAPGEGTVLSPLGSSYPVGAGLLTPASRGD